MREREHTPRKHVHQWVLVGEPLWHRLMSLTVRECTCGVREITETALLWAYPTPVKAHADVPWQAPKPADAPAVRKHR